MTITPADSSSVGREPVQPETAQAISQTMVRVIKIMSAMKHHAPREHPAVDPSHYPLLFCVSGEPRRVSAVADSIHSDVSTVSRQVTHLVQHGLLEKIGDPDDGRAQLLSLSPSGRTVIEKLVQRRGSWFEQLLSTWTDEEACDFERYLSRFGDDVETVKAQLVAQAGAPPAPAPVPPPPPAPVASRPDADDHFLRTLSRTNQEL
ncbi:MAG: MarR family transcriptional regulator, partial [Lapillicoccus sp.]